MCLLSITDLTQKEILLLIDKAVELKKNPKRFSNALKGKTLLLLFEKPSLRTRVSFEVAMFQLGGQAIYIDASTTPLGKGKETIADTAKTAARYVDAIAARLFEQKTIEELAKNSTVPVINALTNEEHPCQILADLMTIKEKKGKLNGLKVAYLGDANDNVLHSLLLACAMLGINISVAYPNKKEFSPNAEAVKKAEDYANRLKAKIELTNNPKAAVSDAAVVVTDSWMSYHIPKSQEKRRVKELMPYQVNSKLLKLAKKDAAFMHCLPAKRGQEVTSEVIDGKKSVVFDEAENRLHTAKALLLKLLK